MRIRTGKARGGGDGPERPVETPLREPASLGGTSGSDAVLPTGSEVLAGGVWTGISRFVPQIYTLAISIVAARILGPSGMGRQSFIGFVEATAIFAFTAGLPFTLSRYVARSLGAQHPQEVRLLLRWAWRIEAVGAIIAGATLVAVGLAGAAPRSAWVLAGVAASLSILYAVPSTLLVAVRRWRQAAIIPMATGLLSTASTVIVLVAGGGIVGMFAVEAAVAAIGLVVVIRLSRTAIQHIGHPDAPSPSLDMAAVRRYTLIVSLTSALDYVVWRRTEFYFLAHYSTSTQIALYSIPFAAVTALARLPDPIARVVSPTVATLSGAGHDQRIRTGFGRGMRLLLFASLALTAGALALGPETLKLAYGDDYRDTSTVLLLLLIPFPLLPLLSLAAAVVMALGKLKINALTMLFAALLNIGMDFVLIPQHGAIGAAIANASAQVAGSVPMIAYAVMTVGRDALRPRFVVKAIAVASGTGVAAFAIQQSLPGAAGVTIGVVGGVLAFVVLARLFRVLPAADGVWLDETAGRRLGGWVGRASRAWAEPQPQPQPPGR
ncbi:MAG TPA: polysaccharide biosynthesis C-terminal domain-containing protein [Gaiellaceae bacterium]|nr:polysaccharide biosynthesis C-terminal domain-containing protein [Gaiellaceae bacterium]